LGLHVLQVQRLRQRSTGRAWFMRKCSSPLGLRNSASMGVVSAPARAINDENPILYIQTDASINPGNSGGALVDTQGSLIGMNTFIVSQSGGNEGIGFAIPQQCRPQRLPSNPPNRTRIERIYRNRGPGHHPVMARGLHLPVQSGVVVADVTPESPAEAGRVEAPRCDPELQTAKPLRTPSSCRMMCTDGRRRENRSHGAAG